MHSNFIELKKINPQLFDVIYSAEKLLINKQYDYIPTALRVFAEGIMKEVVGDYQFGSDLRSLIEQFSDEYPRYSLVSAAANELRKEGNKTSHFVPPKYQKKHLVKLFQSATRLCNYYLVDFKKEPIQPIKFEENKLPKPALFNFSNEISDQINSNFLTDDKLLEKITNYEEQLAQLEMVRETFKNELKLAQNRIESQNQKIKIATQEINQLNEMISKFSESEKPKLIDKIKVLEDQISALSEKNVELEQEKYLFERKLKEVEETKINQESYKEDLLQEIKHSQSNSNNPFTEIHFDEQQERLLEITEGRHFIIAPPGSGKTAILIKRLEKHLPNYEDHEVINLTFTTKAAKEMQSRALKAIGSKRNPFIGNFHRFCLDLLRNDDRLFPQERFAAIIPDTYRDIFFYRALTQIKSHIKEGFDIKLPEILIDIVNEFASEFGDGLKNEQNTRFDKYMFYRIYPYFKLVKETKERYPNLVKEHLGKSLYLALISCHKSFYGSVAAIDLFQSAKILYGIFEEFDFLKHTNRTIDYDDVLCLGLKILSDQPQPKKFIQVDEVQDLNPIQWAIISELANKESHLFVVGDKEQSIYGFLGADIDNLDFYTNSFQKHFLINNYRSNEHITSLLNLYRQKAWNLPSIVPSGNHLAEPGTLLICYDKFENEIEGTKKIVQKILKNPNRSIGLLLPTNKQVDLFSHHFTESKIKHFKVGSSDIMQKNIVQVWLSCIKAHKGNAQNVDWYNIVNRLAHKDDPNTGEVVELVNSVSKLGVYFGDILTEENSNSNLFNYRLKRLVHYWENREVVIFDTETTGLDFENSKIIQIAAIKVRNGNILEKFNEYINIDLDNSDKEIVEDYENSFSVHKITRETLSKGGFIKDVLNRFFCFIGGSPLIAHNMNFDNTMLRMGVMSLSDYKLQQLFVARTERLQFDTLLLSKQLLPDEPSYKLANLLEKYNLEGVNSHNAIDDVIATSSLLTLLISKIKTRLDSIDKIIDKHHETIFNLTKSYHRITNLLKSYYMTGSKVTLSDFLCDWLDISTAKNGWYCEINYQEVNDIKNKLVPWLNENGYVGHIHELFNDMDPKTQELFTLKESDLIDVNKDKLVISTIHRSKGLEFDTAIIPQVTNRFYPGWIPEDTTNEEKQKHEEEKIRLLYVAMSRPINKLIMSYHQTYSPNSLKTDLYELISDCRDGFKLIM
jgi:DNA helicase-2/ATP-dependent DNA helicase PcrA